MAFRPLPQPRALAPAVALTTMALHLSTPRTLSAEEPRKPIYDDTRPDTTAPPPTESAAPAAPPSSSTTTTSTTPPQTYRLTPTDRLALQIRCARLALHHRATLVEDALNAALTSTLHLEHAFTSTIRSLAPPKDSGERIFPNALYVLVASMAGSIATRNRNMLLRATFPAAIGLGAAYAVLPLTMRNVGDLAWTYEERFPVVAEAHVRTRERVGRFWETGKAHTAMSVGMVQDKVAETRERMEGWVRKGR